MAAPSARVGIETPTAFDAAAAPAIRLLSTHANLNHSPGCQYAGPHVHGQAFEQLPSQHLWSIPNRGCCQEYSGPCCQYQP